LQVESCIDPLRWWQFTASALALFLLMLLPLLLHEDVASWDPCYQMICSSQNLVAAMHSNLAEGIGLLLMQLKLLWRALWHKIWWLHCAASTLGVMTKSFMTLPQCVTAHTMCM